MTGLALVSLMTGFLLVYSGFKAIDPRCLITKTFKPGTDCPRIDTGEANPFLTAQSGIGMPSSTTQSGGLPSGTTHTGTWNYNDSAVNSAKATAAEAAILARFPGTRSGGICNCRYMRGSTAPSGHRWSVHSVCGAVDIWPSPYPADSIIAFAKSLPMVWDAWLDSSPGDVHVQVVPNPPADWIPPCAATGAARKTL